MIRIGIAGAGLAGALLAWRLAPHPGVTVEVVAPCSGGVDATSVSGGLVRGFETDLESCRLAADSLAELHASDRLRAWSRYTNAGSVYVCDGTDAAGVAERIEVVERRLPGSARTVTAGKLTERHGWTGLPADAVGVVEARAGYFSPARLRTELVVRLPALGVEVVDGAVEQIAYEPGAGADCWVAGRRRRYDALVVAAGSWTPRLLAASGLPAGTYRTKAVEYAVHVATGWRPTAFVDDTSGLYGRPDDGGRVILGIPSERWDVDPDRHDPCERTAATAARLAAVRLPRLRLTRMLRLVRANDCYRQADGLRAAGRPGLALRDVVVGVDSLVTFSAGSGGSAKTALAASREAARELVARLSGEAPATDLRDRPAAATSARR